MVEYIIEGRYKYDDYDQEWEQDYTYDDQDKAIEMFKALTDVKVKGVEWRLRKVISETLCES